MIIITTGTMEVAATMVVCETQSEARGCQHEATDSFCEVGSKTRSITCRHGMFDSLPVDFREQLILCLCVLVLAFVPGVLPHPTHFRW